MSTPSMASTPFIRKIWSPRRRSIGMRNLWKCISETSPGVWMPQLVTEASCVLLPSKSRKLGFVSSVRSKSKAWMSSTILTSTSDCVQRWIGATLLMARSLASMRCSSSSSGTRSVLLSKRRSAKATCSTASCMTPSGFSSSRCCTMCLASTSVTIPSNSKRSSMTSSAKNVCATGPGLAIPVVSMITASSLSPLTTTRSPRR
mmetsp:Transcript_2238/g.9689  ORF Transcript_2238/g.9689 Transcript_2238/m.9689 type:complete len:203 (+) Transcript_2238:605-1213(+)